MGEIRAIETEYAGVLFRSRLEARWAVFFDVLGIRWDFEPEGYQLKDGTRYVPDFWLRKDPLPMSLFLEVKPQGGLDEEALHKARLLALGARQDVAIIEMSQFPGEHSRAEEFQKIYTLDWMEDGAPLYEVEGGYFGQCQKCKKLLIAHPYMRCAACSGPHWEPPGAVRFFSNTPALMIAYEAARCARFWEPGNPEAAR